MDFLVHNLTEIFSHFVGIWWKRKDGQNCHWGQFWTAVWTAWSPMLLLTSWSKFLKLQFILQVSLQKTGLILILWPLQALNDHVLFLFLLTSQVIIADPYVGRSPICCFQIGTAPSTVISDFSFAFPDVCLHVCLHTPFPISMIRYNTDCFSSSIRYIIIKLMDNCWINYKIANESQLLTSRQHGKPLIQGETAARGSNQVKRGRE